MTAFDRETGRNTRGFEMLDANYEDQARQLQDEINELTARLREVLDSLKSAEAALDEDVRGSRLADRNRFFLWLRNGDHTVYERIRTHREDCRHFGDRSRTLSARLGDLEREILDVIREGSWGDPNYRAIREKLGELASTRTSCRRLLDLAATARAGIADATTSLKADGEVREVSDKIRSVRHQAAALNDKARSHGLAAIGQTTSLKVDFSGRRGDVDTRLRKLRSAHKALVSVEKDVHKLLGIVTEQETAVDNDLRHYLRTERARFE